jgi:biotin--protein ligase
MTGLLKKKSFCFGEIVGRFMLRLYVSRNSGELGRLAQWFARQDFKGRSCQLVVGEEKDGEEGTVQMAEVDESFQVADTSQFDVGKYFGLLKVRGLAAGGRRLLYSPQVSSTQELLQGRLFMGWEDWRLAFVADRQTQGKGRGQNQWESPAGCLMWSFQLVQTNGLRLPMLQYLFSLALVEAVRLLPGQKKTEQGLKIKWPNDLYLTDQETPVKVGGILCQSSYWKQQFVVTVGIGLNVSNAEPTRCVRELFERPELVTREAVLASFFTVLEDYMDEFDRTGFESFREAYEANWMHSGQSLTLEDGAKVVVEGLSPQGLLLARDLQTDVTVELQPDHNSLDWFKGLVKKKILQ